MTANDPPPPADQPADSTPARPGSDASSIEDPAAAIREFERAPKPGFVYARADREARNRPWLRRMRRARRAVLFPVVRYLGSALFRAYGSTWRILVDGVTPDRAEVFRREGCLGVFWHGRSLAVLRALRAYPADVLVSPSGDGQLVMELIGGLGHGVIEGSRSRGGSRAIREMLASLRSGRTIAITPDGPRGPLHSITEGVAFLARETGFPVVPIGIAVDRGWYASSWDHFVVPRPFARIQAWIGAPLQVQAGADEDALRARTLEIREALLDAERQAARALGVEVDW